MADVWCGARTRGNLCVWKHPLQSSATSEILLHSWKLTLSPFGYAQIYMVVTVHPLKCHSFLVFLRVLPRFRGSNSLITGT